MSENLQKYAVSVDFDAAISKINKLKTASKSMNRAQESSLLLQITLQKRLNALKTNVRVPVQPVAEFPRKPVTQAPQNPKPQTPQVEQPTRPRQRTPREDFVGPMPQKTLLKQYETEKKINKALEARRQDVMNILSLQKKVATSQQKQHIEEVERNILTARNKVQIKQIMRAHRFNTAQLNKQNFLMQKLGSSSKQIAGNMVSAFAVAAGVGNIIKIGQDLERANNTLTAITGSTEKAGLEMEYLKEVTYRMGIPLRETAKDYAKLMASANGLLSEGKLKTLFEDLTKAAVVLGTTTQEQGLVFKALTQMLSKQKVSAEEYRQQLGESMPVALQAMAKAGVKSGIVTDSMIEKFGNASGAIEDLMAKGKLYSKDILPFFGAEINKIVSPGYEKALDSNVNAMGRLQNVWENTAGSIFTGKFEKGLTKFFNSTADLLKDNQPLWESLGKIMGSVLKGLSHVVSVASSVLSVLGSVMKSITSVLGDFSAIAAIAFSPLIWVTGVNAAIGGVTGLSVALGILKKTAMGIAAPFLIVYGVLEEVAEFFNPSGKRTAIGFNVNDITKGIEKFKEDVKKLGTIGAVSKVADDDFQSNTAKLGFMGAVMKKIYTPTVDDTSKKPPIVIENKVTVELEGEAFNSRVNNLVNENMGYSLDGTQ